MRTPEEWSTELERRLDENNHLVMLPGWDDVWSSIVAGVVRAAMAEALEEAAVFFEPQYPGIAAQIRALAGGTP